MNVWNRIPTKDLKSCVKIFLSILHRLRMIQHLKSNYKSVPSHRKIREILFLFHFFTKNSKTFYPNLSMEINEKQTRNTLR